MGESTPTDSDDNPSALNGAVIFTRLVAPKTNRATADGSDRDEHTAAQLPSPAASPLVLFPNLMQPKFRKLFLDVKSDALVLQKPVDEPRHSDSSGDMHGDRFECGSTCLSRETLTYVLCGSAFRLAYIVSDLRFLSLQIWNSSRHWRASKSVQRDTAAAGCCRSCKSREHLLHEHCAAMPEQHNTTAFILLEVRINTMIMGECRTVLLSCRRLCVMQIQVSGGLESCK